MTSAPHQTQTGTPSTYDPPCLSVCMFVGLSVSRSVGFGWSLGRSVGRPVGHYLLKGGKLHFHALNGAIIFFTATVFGTQWEP